MARRARPPQRLRGESGFSLIELLVASTIAFVVFSAVLTFISSATTSEAGTGQRVAALGQQRAGLEHMTRELRQATGLTSATAGPSVDFVLDVPSSTTDLQIRYECTEASECRRYEAPVGQSFPPTYHMLVSDVQSATFTPQSVTDGGDYVAVELRVSLPDSVPIVLTDGVHLRNKALD